MSQYVPGVIDYVPDIQPYKPDLNFFQQVLQTKQAQYDIGYKKLSSLYGTLLNSPMLKNENIELRNKFFNDISANITKISAMDLSIEQNVNSARKVFQPLIDNDYIMKDMAFTKKYQQALDRHEYFKNCLDEKSCGGKYWTEGLKYINYQAEDFIKASLDESLTFQNPEYVPFTNAVQKAVQLAKDMDFKVNNLTKSGGYNIITENGVQMIPDLTDFFMSNFANDGNIRRVYDVLAYNKRKDYARNNAQYFGDSEEQAEINYLDSMAGFISSTTEQERERALQKLDASKSKQRLGNEVIKEVGVDPNDPADQGIVNDVKQSITDQLIAQSSADIYDKANQLVASDSFNDSDIVAKRNRIDAAMSDSLFSADMMNAASSYAKLTYKIKSYDADPFALKRMEFENAKALKQLQYDLDYKLAKEKGEIVEPSEEPAESDPAVPGGSLENADLYAAEEVVKRTFGQNAAGAVADVVAKWDADMVAMLKTDIGTPLPSGKIMTAALKEEIARKRESVLNQGDTRTESEEIKENSTADYLWTDLKGSLYSAWNWIASPFTGETSEQIRAKEKAYIDQELAEEAETTTFKNVEVTDKGFINNGVLGDVKNNASFYNPASINHYDKVFERLTSIYTDPSNSLFIASVGLPDGALQDRIEFAEKQRLIAKVENDRIAHNTAVITGSFENMDIDLSGYSDPVLAKEMASKITYGDDKGKYFRDRSQFVNDYLKEFRKRGEAAEAKRQQTLDQLQNMSLTERIKYKIDNGIGYLGTASPLYQSNDSQVQAEAADLYDLYMEKFKSEYNRADDATKPYADFRTWNPYGGSNGSGSQANPYTIRGVDPRFPNTPGASSFKWTHHDLLKAMADPQFSDRVAIFNGDPGQFTADNIEEAYEKTQADKENALAVLQIIRDDIRQGKKGDDAGRFDIQFLPIVGNSGDLVGVKIKPSPRLLEAHKGGKDTPGYTAGLSEIGIILPREAVSKENPGFSGLDRTPEDIVMDAYNEVNISAYSKLGGRALITRAPGGFNYEVRTMVFDPATGKFNERLAMSDFTSELTAGQLAKEINPYLADIYMKNMNHQQEYKKNNKQNRITDPSQLGINP